MYVWRTNRALRQTLLAQQANMLVKDIFRLCNENLHIKGTLLGVRSIFRKNDPQSLLVALHLNPPQNADWLFVWQTAPNSLHRRLPDFLRFASRIQWSLRDQDGLTRLLHYRCRVVNVNHARPCWKKSRTTMTRVCIQPWAKRSHTSLTWIKSQKEELYSLRYKSTVYPTLFLTDMKHLID